MTCGTISQDDDDDDDDDDYYVIRFCAETDKVLQYSCSSDKSSTKSCGLQWAW